MQDVRRNKQEMETILASERTRSAQDRLTLHQTIEGLKKQMNELESKLRDREIEADETKRTLQLREDQVERYKALAKRTPSSETYAPQWTPSRVGYILLFLCDVFFLHWRC